MMTKEKEKIHIRMLYTFKKNNHINSVLNIIKIYYPTSKLN